MVPRSGLTPISPRRKANSKQKFRKRFLLKNYTGSLNIKQSWSADIKKRKLQTESYKYDFFLTTLKTFLK